MSIIMNNNLNLSLKKQKGAAVLLVSIVLLIGVTLITIFAARVGVMDQRIAGNEYRHKEAKAAADAALEQAASFITHNKDLYHGSTTSFPWVDCIGSIATQFPCANTSGTPTYDKAYDGILSTTTIDPLQDGNGTGSAAAIPLANGANAESYLVYTASATVGNILTAIGTGFSLDGTGTAYSQISYTEVSLLTPGKIPPIMTPVIDLGGNFTIVADPNGGGSGVAVSAWVSTFDTSSGIGSWQTCQLGDLRVNGSGTGDVCPETKSTSVSWGTCECVPDLTLSKSNPLTTNYDIVNVDTSDFPASPFEYIFPAYNGDFDALYTAAKGLEETGLGAAIETDDCSDLDTIVAGLSQTKSVLIAAKDTGTTCNPPNGIFGTRDAPIMLVIEGDLIINGNVDIYGIVVVLGTAQLSGGAVIHGSLVAEVEPTLSGGGYTQVYDEYVLASLAEDFESIGLAKQAYSWIDIRQ